MRGALSVETYDTFFPSNLNPDKPDPSFLLAQALLFLSQLEEELPL